MVELGYPGVYVVEVPPTARVVTPASTSTAAFIGMAKKGPMDKAHLVSSFPEFLKTFGGFTTKDAIGIEDRQIPSDKNIYLTYAVWAFFKNGGRKCYIIRVAPDATSSSIKVPGENSTAFTVRTISPGSSGNELFVAITNGTIDLPDATLDDPKRKKSTYKIEVKTDEGNVLESFDGVIMDKGTDNSVDTYINENSGLIKIYDVNYHEKPKLKPEQPSAQAASKSRELGGPKGLLQDQGYKLEGGTAGRDVSDEDVLDQLTVGKSALDEINNVSLIAAPGFTSYKVINAGFAYAERHRNGLGDTLFIADVPSNISNKNEIKDFVTDARFQPNDNGYGALYYPWIKVKDEIDRERDRVVLVPPSGFVGGIYSRTDNVNGVWKAPAGVEAVILGHQGLTVDLNEMDQGVIDLVGINVIRTFPGYGTLVVGSRTVSRNIAWRYVAVRRMANFIKSSIFDSIQWAIFEPNDEPLWNAVRLTIGRFMMDLFRQGAFQGSNPSQAYFVKCDNETTTDTDRQNGIINAVIGFAPLKPAEFITMTLSQKTIPVQSTANTIRDSTDTRAGISEIMPYRNFKFKVYFEGKSEPIALLSKISPLRRLTECVEWRQDSEVK